MDNIWTLAASRDKHNLQAPIPIANFERLSNRAINEKRLKTKFSEVNILSFITSKPSRLDALSTTSMSSIVFTHNDKLLSSIACLMHNNRVVLVLFITLCWRINLILIQKLVDKHQSLAGLMEKVGYHINTTSSTSEGMYSFIRTLLKSWWRRGAIEAQSHVWANSHAWVPSYDYKNRNTKSSQLVWSNVQSYFPHTKALFEEIC